MSTTALNLLNNAHSEGDLNKTSLQALTAIPDIGATIQQGLGIPADQVRSSEVVLINILVDDSGSMSEDQKDMALKDGYNLLLEALKGSKQQDNIEIYVRYLNGTLLCPYTPLDNAPVMDAGNYSATGGTPLYDETAKLLATVIAKKQEFQDNGIQVRTITLIMTDGKDLHSRTNNERDINNIVSDMLRSEDHIVAAMGFGNGFRSVFTDMGIQNQWILEESATASEIRKAFNVFSQSAIRASQSAAAFSQSNLGGFGG